MEFRRYANSKSYILEMILLKLDRMKVHTVAPFTNID